jgi:isopenicillin N synthase-like dioxygenase
MTRTQTAEQWVLLRRTEPTNGTHPPGKNYNMYELICHACGDDAELAHHDVAPRLQHIRGPYPLPAAIAAYEQHVAQHDRR